MNRSFLSLLFLSLTITACSATGNPLIPVPTEGVPAVLELGELDIISVEDWDNETTRMDLATYADVGAADTPTGDSGATFTFLGNGGTVCLVVDPEAVYWNQSVARLGPNPAYIYPDNFLDDGDLDMSAGLSANYTGSPGLALGDFAGFYTDSLGQTVELEYNECTMTGSRSQTPAHGGRAHVESCKIDTTGREDIEFTVVLKTFSLPLDDFVLSFATAVTDGNCRNVTECSLKGESPQEGFEDLEDAYCTDTLTEYCRTHPDMCGEFEE